MGDKAPPEWKEKAKQLEIQRQIDHLASKEKEKEREPETDGPSELDVYVETLSDYLEEVPDTMPFVKAMMEEDTDSALENLYRAADMLYTKNPHLGVPTPEEAAEFLEKAIAVEHEKAAERYNRVKGKKPAAKPSLASRKARARTSKDKQKPLTEEEQIQRAIVAAQKTLS